MNPLNVALSEFIARNGELFVLTSLMGLFNRPEVLADFLDRGPNAELRIFAQDPSSAEHLLSASPAGFHVKAFLFEKQDGPKVLAIGSANLTNAGLSTNTEWDYLSDFEVYDRASAFRRQLADHLEDPSSSVVSGPASDSSHPVPRPSQEEILANIAKLRNDGERKYAVIAATGIGKTRVSAFEVRDSACHRVLFIAHRETILEQAATTFRRVMPDSRQVLVQGRSSLQFDRGGKVQVFAMVQTLARDGNYQAIGADYFEYVIIDEFHHVEAEGYRRILQYFRPTYQPGLTATPERTDGLDVLQRSDRNVAYAVRLLEAIRRKWLAPFQYYARYDETDYDQIRWTGTGYDEVELEQALSSDTRADLICRNLARFQPVEGKRKCIVFCSNVGHARWMAKVLTHRGFPATWLSGDSTNDERGSALASLQNEEEALEVVCAVDILNEGIDVPNLTHVLMPRPTLSFTVFIQQLGRGLRVHPGESVCHGARLRGQFQAQLRRSVRSFRALHGTCQRALQKRRARVSRA